MLKDIAWHEPQQAYCVEGVVRRKFFGIDVTLWHIKHEDFFAINARSALEEAIGQYRGISDARIFASVRKSDSEAPLNSYHYLLPWQSVSAQASKPPWLYVYTPEHGTRKVLSI